MTERPALCSAVGRIYLQNLLWRRTQMIAVVCCLLCLVTSLDCLRTLNAAACTHHNDSTTTYLLYSVSQKIPLSFSGIFPKRFGIFSPNFTVLLHISIYARLQFFYSITCNFGEVMPYYARPPCSHHMLKMSTIGRNARWVVTLIWHNFVKVAGNWIKMCNLASTGTYNRQVKFRLNIPNRLGENVRKTSGGII